MKLKINKASDLSSISVLPPHFRRSNAATGPQSSQLRSQPSQQSFSQGLSSQHGVFSQLSQNSLDEVLTNDQRFGSEERENYARKHSFLPPLNFTREDSQIPISKSSANVMGKWNPNAYTHRQVSETTEHSIGMIETSLNRSGMILDSIQSDIMQVNKGTKEILLEMEGIRKTLIAHDNSLQQLNKRQDDVKASIDMSLQSISDKLSKDIYQDKLQEIFSTISTLEQKIQAFLMKSQDELLNTFMKELQDFGRLTTAKRITYPPKSEVAPLPKEEVGGWKSVKAEKSISKTKNQLKQTSSIAEHKICSPRKRMQPERVGRVIIDSDEEINEGFSYLIEDQKDASISSTTGNYSLKEAKEETERIMRKARNRKRKCRSPIIIN